MLKKALFLLMVLLTVPNFASAYNYWTISANSSPNIAGAVSISGADYSTSGSTVNVVTSGVTTADFTVNPAPAGYTLAYVSIDGVKYTAPNNGAFYRVNKGNRLNHTLSAVYSVKKYSVTTSKTGNGYIDPTVQVASGSSKTVNITAGVGYKIGTVTDGGAVLTAGDGVYNAAYTFSGITENKTISVAFVPAPAVDAKISTSAQTIARGAALVIDGSTSTSSVPATYTWSVLPATGATVVETVPGKASFLATAAGTYTVQLTVAADAQTTDVATVIITVSNPTLIASSACTACHAERDAANVADYTASKHAADTVTCQSCHTNGADSMFVKTQTQACTTCHSAENSSMLLGKHGAKPYGYFADLCASCHSSHNPVVTAAVCVTCHKAPHAPEYHDVVAQANCVTCHNSHTLAPLAGTIGVNHIGGQAYPATAPAVVKAQYVSANVTCANCHAGSNAAILAEYKESAHGDVDGLGWKNYDWRSASRAACQRCHNGTVFSAKLETLADVTNYFGATPPVAASEVLNCSACHANVETGELRAASNQFTVPFSNGASIAYDVPGSSALCVRCHGGRESGDSIKNKVDAFTNLSFINSHYLAAGGMVYNKIGYEFAGQTYDTLGYHKNVGKDNVFQTGNAGPCVACHMSTGEGHTWDFVTKDANGVITANNSTLCASCHDVNMTAAALEEAKEAVHAGLTELQAALAGKGILFVNAHPYFYKDLNGNGVYDAATEAGSGNAFKNWDAVYPGLGKDVMGAAFNFNLIEHDPGAYAHNRAYALKLISDSIDFINDGVIDGDANSAATALATGIWKPNAGTSTNHSSIANDASCASCHANGINPSTAEIEATLPDANGGCGSCHQGRVNSFITSVHYTAAGNTAQACSFCHSSTNHGNPVVTCTPCHSQEMEDAFHAAYATPGPAGTNCKDCHAGGGHPHSIKTTAAANLKTKCIECHAVALSHTGDYVKDNNNGVRAITTEFQKWSHHVTGVDLQDAHCAACHLEGKVENGKIVVDPAKHMADAKTHLRDADTDADFAWDPSAPDHAGMDNFCMSCHDANGATSPASLAIQAVIIPAAGKTASPSNPFGDTISNKYDKMQRPAVVDVKGQFDLTNPSHHAVMGSRYTGRTTAAGPRQIANPAAFGQNSSAWLPGTRQTLYEAGKLNSAYATLTGINGDTSLGDDSVLHCGDCHTVGQWQPGSSVDINGNPTTAAIGAHGSENEYMLRNTAGTDAKNVPHTLDATGAVNNWGAPWLVCYNCHAFQAYGSPRSNTTTHSGEYNVANFRCNSPQFTYANYTTGTIITAGGVPMNQTRLTYKLGAAGPGSGSSATGGNIFGNQCANCHNSGPQNGFGGIHGSKVKTYKDGTGAAQKAYRFMPGLGNSMYNPGSMGANNNGTAAKGSVDDKNWEQRALTTANREGCYTLTASSAGNAPGRIGAGNTVNGAEVFGTWGACTDHGGTSVQGGTGVVRKVIRPVSY